LLRSYISGVEEEKNIVSKLSEKLFSILSQYNILSIIFYPTLDNYIAATIALAALSIGDIKVVLTPSLDVPTDIDIPAILLDYSIKKNIKAPYFILIEKDKRVVEDVGNGVRAGVYSSTPVFILKLLESSAIITDEMQGYAIISAANKQNTRGLDHDILSQAQDKELIERYEAALRIFDWHKLPICDALSLTINPLIPGISGRKENCITLLSDEGIKILNSKGEPRKIIDLSDNELRKLVEILHRRIRSKFRLVDAGSLVSRTYVLVKCSPISVEDTRFAYQLLRYVSEIEDPGYIVASMINKLYASYIRSIYINACRDVALEIEDIILNERYVNSTKTIIVETESELPPSFLGEVLREYMDVSKNKPVIICSKGRSKCYTSIAELELAKRRVINSSNVELRGIRIISESIEYIEEAID